MTVSNQPCTGGIVGIGGRSLSPINDIKTLSTKSPEKLKISYPNKIFCPDLGLFWRDKNAKTAGAFLCQGQFLVLVGFSRLTLKKGKEDYRKKGPEAGSQVFPHSGPVPVWTTLTGFAVNRWEAVRCLIRRVGLSQILLKLNLNCNSQRKKFFPLVLMVYKKARNFFGLTSKNRLGLVCQRVFFTFFI
ncbi:MAG: hypothetical protein LBT47_00165 [Deltaproteobacteria bacterium]|nr:hypothetical protein [Deltaproteobacteria bacterium]